MWLFEERAGKRYAPDEQRAFVTELDKEIRWFFVNFLLERKTVGFVPSPITIEEDQLTDEQQEVLSDFSRCLRIRRIQLHRHKHSFAGLRASLAMALAYWLHWVSGIPQPPLKVQRGATLLFAIMRSILAERGYSYSESVLLNFATENVAGICDIAKDIK